MKLPLSILFRPLLFVALLLGIGLSAQPAQARLRVVATTPDLAAISSELGGSRVTVSALALPTQDPHFVDARPHLALDLARADLLVLVGAELEIGWLPTLLQGSRNGNIQVGTPGYLDTSTLVSLLEVPATKVERSMGDIHPQGSPHFLLDPRRAERVAVGIGKRLSELDPEGHDLYLQNTKRFVADLRQKRAVWEQKLAGLRGKPIIGYHKSLSYIADWLGLDVLDYLEPKPGIPPNPRHVAQVVELAKSRNARCLLQEQWYPSGTARLAAQNIGVPLLVIPGMTNFPAGQSYGDFLATVVDKLASLT
jgi:zinc/manganese transport system substrate-binding protein